MGDRVFASEGGRRFHRDRLCPNFLAAQELWRFDPMQWVPGMPQIMLSNGHRLDEMTVVTAFGRGKEPCATCYPELRAALYRGNCEDDFGHEPVYNQHLGPVCQRCVKTVTHYDEAYQPSRWTRPIPWPCTSAIVLGLAPRTEAS